MYNSVKQLANGTKASEVKTHHIINNTLTVLFTGFITHFHPLHDDDVVSEMISAGKCLTDTEKLLAFIEGLHL